MLLHVSYTHIRAHETPEQLVCRLLLEKTNILVVGKNASQCIEGMYEIVGYCLRKADESEINSSNAFFFDEHHPNADQGLDSFTVRSCFGFWPFALVTKLRLIWEIVPVPSTGFTRTICLQNYKLRVWAYVF